MKSSRQASAIGAATVSTGAALTAGIAGACCVGPALGPIFLAVLGSSGLIAVTSLRPYTPWMLAASGVMLGFSFWQTHRRPVCVADGTGLPVSRGSSSGLLQSCGLPQRLTQCMDFYTSEGSMFRKSFVASIAGFAVAGCAHTTSNAPFEDIAAGGEPLKAAFNRNADRVRIVLLVSPT